MIRISGVILCICIIALVMLRAHHRDERRAAMVCDVRIVGTGKVAVVLPDRCQGQSLGSTSTQPQVMDN